MSPPSDRKLLNLHIAVRQRLITKRGLVNSGMAPAQGPPQPDHCESGANGELIRHQGSHQGGTPG
ncbi:MAG TPA: hypothetical protein DHU96_27740 [Actinobacteria bacterium]|nr:hypothetical protein [Actinomycetota bacterium]